MAKNNEDVNLGLSWIGTILHYIKDFGFFNIIKAIAIILILSITLRICFNPTFLFNKYTEFMKERHSIELDHRLNNDKKVNEILQRLLYTSGADRVYVIQYHNGTSDFTFCSMRFEKCGPGIKFKSSESNNIYLSWLELPHYLETHKYFVDSVSKLEPIDKVLYSRYKDNGVEYLACALILDEQRKPIGILGYSWEHAEEVKWSAEELKERLVRNAGIISQYLTP